MKLEVSKTDLLRAIDVAGRAVNSKSPLPIYASLMLEVLGTDLLMTSTDGEITLAVCCPLEISEVVEGKVAVIAEGFISVVKGMPGPIISIEREKNTLVIKSKRSRYCLPLITGESWPVIPRVEADISFTVHERLLATQLLRVLPAVGTDASRQIVCGVYFKLTERLSLVATDTHRLHVATVTIPQAKGEGNWVLATAAAKELARLLTADDDCQVTTDGGCLKVVGAWGTFISRLIVGTYLAYERFIPQQAGYVEFPQADLSDAIKRAAFVAQGCADRLVVTILSNNSATLEAASDQGEALETLSLVYSDLDNIVKQQFAVSARNFGAAVAAVPDSFVRVYRTPASRAILIAGEDTDKFFAVCIPMRLPSDA